MPPFLIRLRKGGIAALVLSVAASQPVHAQIWPQLYDPMVVLTLDLTVSAQDWDTVRRDTTFTTYVPAYLSMPGEPSILVAVRRKSSVALPKPGGGPEKVSLKIDINLFVEQSWHGVKKLSLENGGDTSTLREGFAWYLHRLAYRPGGYPYMPGLASWVKVYVNGLDYGVYSNVEQVDKRFHEWRGLWLSDDTWLYKQSDMGAPTIDVGPLTHSPTYNTLCYSPFPPQTCPTPPPEAVATELSQLIDMQGMLTLGAVDAWCYSPDNLFAKGKNHFYSDSRYRKRLYYPWDIDANFGDMDPNHSIYQLGPSAYVTVILDNPTFRTQYNIIMQSLLNGPFATTNLTSAINSLESVLLPAMSTDPYNPVSASDFTALRNYVSARNTNVATQLSGAAGVSTTTTTQEANVLARPNPFQAVTRVEFQMKQTGPMLVRVYDAQGALVRTLADRQLPAGPYYLEWDGTNDLGRPVGAGVYFVSGNSDGRTWNRKVTLLR
jgi:hypothetical protein